LLGGDAAGYPNGRRVFDDVVTIELRAVAGLTYQVVHGASVFTADGAAGAIYDVEDPSTNKAPVDYLSSFPYLNTPDSGFSIPARNQLGAGLIASSAPVQLRDLTAHDQDGHGTRPAAMPQSVLTFCQRPENRRANVSATGLPAQHTGVNPLGVATLRTDLDLLTAQLVARIDDEGSGSRPDVDHDAALKIGLMVVLTHKGPNPHPYNSGQPARVKS
jgi:hypothetical protein